MYIVIVGPIVITANNQCQAMDKISYCPLTPTMSSSTCRDDYLKEGGVLGLHQKVFKGCEGSISLVAKKTFRDISFWGLVLRCDNKYKARVLRYWTLVTGDRIYEQNT